MVKEGSVVFSWCAGWILILMLFVSILSIPICSARAEVKTIAKEFTYWANDNDSRLSSQIIARSQVKRLILEDLRGHLMDTPVVMEHSLTREQVSRLLAGIVSTEITNEEWNGTRYYVRARAAIDMAEVARAIDNSIKDQEIGGELEETGQEGERITKELETAKENRKKQAEYNKVIHELNAITWVESGYALRNSNSHVQSIEAFNSAIEADPEYARAYIGRSGTYRRLGQYGKAIEDADRAIGLDPRIASAYSNRGLAYACLGKYDNAIEDYNRGIAINPKEARFFFNRGLAYSMLNDYTRAIKDYDMAIDLKPNYAAAYFNRGVSYTTSGNLEKAMENFKASSRLNYKPAQDFLVSEGIQW
jgi:tetratricopeptide (TPR) repeat protein